MKPRALTYTEMMNGGCQQMDQAEHARKQEMQQRVEDLEKNVDRLEQALKNGRAKAVFGRDIFRHRNQCERNLGPRMTPATIDVLNK